MALGKSLDRRFSRKGRMQRYGLRVGLSLVLGSYVFIAALKTGTKFEWIVEGTGYMMVCAGGGIVADE